MIESKRSVERVRSPVCSLPTRRHDVDAGLPCVIAGLMRGQPELALSIKAAAGLARIDFVDDRIALVSTVLTYRPGALLLPPLDANRTSTAPLILRVRREAPGVSVLVVCSHPSGAGQPMLRAVQAGARVLVSPSAAELRAVLTDALGIEAGGHMET